MPRRINWENHKITTIKKFKKYLMQELGDKRFLIEDNSDPDFSNYPDNQISFHGNDENEVFTFEIIKVK